MSKSSIKSLDFLLKPKSVAVIGVSDKKESLGRNIYDNLASSHFTGNIFAVNPKKKISGIQTVYADVLSIADPVDLAFIVVPKDQVPSVLEQCGKKGVKSVVLVTAGFGEAGQEGQKNEKALKDLAHRYGMRLVGPNCMGVMNTHPAISLNGTFSPVYPPKGNVALCSQSGSLGQAIMDYASSLGIGLSSFVSIGNRIDVNETDLLEYWLDDPDTDVILLYMEAFEDVQNLIPAAKKLNGKKPILALQGGHTRFGERAVKSHTGSLAGKRQAVDALFEKAGILKVDTLDEMFGMTSILCSQNPPRGNRLAIMTNAGGPGILAADRCEIGGLTLANLSEKSLQQLREILPKEASLVNPVDMIASATPDLYAQVLKILHEDTNVDAILVIFINPVGRIPSVYMQAIVDTAQSFQTPKPIVTNFLVSSGRKQILEIFKNKRLPIFSFPEQAVDALAQVWRLTQLAEENDVGKEVNVNLPGREKTKAHFRKVFQNQKSAWLNFREGAELLHAYGISVVPQEFVQTLEQARRSAEKLGYPIVLKAMAEDVLHKTEQGAVLLDLREEASMTVAFSNLQKKFPACKEFVVQKMIGQGVEVAAGVSFEKGFGHLVMFGLGGVHVELFKDVVFCLNPLSGSEIKRLIEKTKAKELLQGFRGAPEMDRGALEHMLLHFSNLIADFPEIQEIDLNPIKVLPKGQGLLVLDWRIR